MIKQWQQIQTYQKQAHKCRSNSKINKEEKKKELIAKLEMKYTDAGWKPDKPKNKKLIYK